VTEGRVLVVGLRTTGDAVVRHCARAGVPVTVVEDDPGQRGFDARVEEARTLGAEVLVAPAAGAWDDLVAGVDLVVPSPGVRPEHPVYAAAAAAGVPVRGDVDLGVELATAPVVAVTGTNGKSTVTSLTTAMLGESGMRAVAAGNIGHALLDVLAASGPPPDVLVVEVSSFQLHATTAAFRPQVAVLTNVAPDHVDWHGSFAEYRAAKAKVFAHQGPDGVLVANADDPIVMELARGAPGVVRTFSGERLEPALSAAVAARGWSAPHDRANVAAAAIAARVAGASSTGEVRAVARFARLHHRVEPVGKAGGVEYLDDSKATNPHATLAAVSGFDRVVLVAGGDSKGIDLGVLRAAAERLRAVVAIGTTPQEVEAVFAGAVPTVRAGSMDDAVTRAAALAEPGDVVLLSPACASYGWYRNYEERGDDFRRAVREHVLAAEGERG
jgi:UDP-N-acetylmuramoylalanine--D-glutamate ligase